jgi:copper ion binding protein
MRTVLKTLVALGLTTTLSNLALLADGACATAAGTCPATAAAKDAACCASKEACCATTATATAAANTCPASSSKLVKVSYRVNGMTCVGCETKVTGALSQIAGVSEPAACAQSKAVKLVYDPTKVKEDQLLAAINKTGFKVEAETIDLKVDGLKCGACSDKVSKKLASVKGVQEQKVCHEGQKALVTFDPHKVSRKDIIAAIDTTGFKVVQ